MRRVYSLLFVVVALGLIAGCGGGDDAEPTGATPDVDRLLEETFAGGNEIRSGQVDMSIRVEAQGGTQEGPVTVELSGPFQSEGGPELPQFQLNASLEGAGQNIEAGVTSTGDEGFVNFQGTDYEVSKPVFDQFKAGYEQAQQQGSQDDQSLASLGIDPREWLTGARYAGESEVGGTATYKITGGVDVPKLLEDLNQALERAGSLGLQGSADVPERLSPEQMRQVEEAIRRLTVEIHTGQEDKILRRMVIALDLQAPQGSDLGAEQAAIAFDLSLLEVNEDQEIEAPDDPRPFQELVGGLGGLGLGLGGGGGSGSGGGGGGGASQENLDKYSQCIQDAGSDTEKARECANLLTP